MKLGRAEMHGAFSSRATGDAVTSVNKQMDKRMDAQGPPDWTLKEGARKCFERGHGFKAKTAKEWMRFNHGEGRPMTLGKRFAK